MDRALQWIGPIRHTARGLALTGQGHLRQHREVQTSAVLLLGLCLHAIDNHRQLLQAFLQARMLSPKRLHDRAHDDLAGRLVGGALDGKIGTPRG